MALKDNIKYYRKAAGLTQRELAAHLNVKHQTIQKYESGEITNIPYNNLTVLAKAMGISVKELLGFSEENAPNKYDAEMAYLICLVEKDKQIKTILSNISKLSKVQKDSLEVIIKGML